MKRLIRSKATRAFLTPEGKWADFCSAHEFPDIESAIDACQKFGVKEAEMLLVMGDKPSQYDAILNIF